MPSNHHDLDAALTAKIRTRKMEWHGFAALGAMTYVLAFTLLRAALDSSIDNTTLIKIMLAPLVITIFLKNKMTEQTKAADEQIQKHFHKVFSDYATTYELLISLGEHIDQGVARSFRRLQLYWAASSLYILCTMMAILLNFFTTR